MVDIPKRTLGRTGVPVTVLGYGAMELRGGSRGRDIPDEQAERVLNAVLDAGINLIDTSPDYGRSEELIGRFIAHRRDEYFLATKCGCLVAVEPIAGGPRHVYTRENIRAAIEQSLRRMKTDRLDLVQFHGSPSKEQLEEHGGAGRAARRCSARARCASSARRRRCRTSPITSRWASSTSSRSRTRRCSASTRR